MSLLDVEDLRVDIPTPGGMLHAVRGISFALERGETLCLVGESGCGKSLTALGLMDLLPRAAKRSMARYTFDGADLRVAAERQMAVLRGNRMAMIFQEPMTALNPSYTIGNQLEEALLQHRKVSRSAARDRAVFMLEKVGITAAASRLGQYPHQLSGGLRQRVMIAMALMCDPQLIIADEPTTALDVTIQAQILRLLADLQSEFKMGLILITHDLGIVARIADQVAVMYAGEIVESGTAAEIFERPMHPYTRGLLQCIPIPGRTQRGSPLGAIPGIVPTPIGPITACQFRNRCPQAIDACAEAPVPLFAEQSGHAARCILSEPARAAAPV